MIDITNLSYKYPNSKENALEKINLKIEKGDFIGIIGESGAGKSSLTRCLNALIPHHYKGDFYGSVKIDETDTFDTNPGKLALKVGSVFQDIDSQMVSIFVEDEILFGLENFNVPKNEIENRISTALSDLGISDLRHREVSSLSGGQKQKVAIAAIIALQPEILVLDEPTGELDPESSVQIFKLLEKLNKEKNITIVVVEQKIMLLSEYAKKLCVMQKGKIVKYGTVREVLKDKDELENLGINVPRTITLSTEMKKAGLIPDSIPEIQQVCLNTNEAATLIKKICNISADAIENETNSSVTSVEAEKNAETQTETLISFDKVHFGYGKGETIHEIDATINKGDFVAIIGSNGAGKSTFVKLCNGLNKPSDGTVLAMGNDTKKTKTSKLAKHIGFLFQNPDSQICCNTIREELAFNLKNANLPEEEINTRVENALKEFNFDGDMEPFNLSRGQRQKLCLASIITLAPEIMILDEPTTGLDYKECMDLMKKIRELNEQGTTVVMVCHDMEVVLDFAKTLIVMTNGKVIAEGKTKAILQNKAILSGARLLPPQIAQTAMELGSDFKNIFTTEEMISKIKELKAKNTNGGTN